MVRLAILGFEHSFLYITGLAAVCVQTTMKVLLLTANLKKQWLSTVSDWSLKHIQCGCLYIAESHEWDWHEKQARRNINTHNTHRYTHTHTHTHTHSVYQLTWSSALSSTPRSPPPPFPFFAFPFEELPLPADELLLLPAVFPPLKPLAYLSSPIIGLISSLRALIHSCISSSESA